jgi:hypothetical protein
VRSLRKWKRRIVLPDVDMRIDEQRFFVGCIKVGGNAGGKAGRCAGR